MKDTKAYISEMKRKLPDIRERLIAVAILLALSVTMIVSTTFAWVVLSTNPEVKGMALAISGNGNLEIALRNTVNVPGVSQIGDSVAAGTAIKDANITWGNLINLSQGYGLDNLALRPARLNKGGLIYGRPLEGVTYGEDGRVEGMQSDYAFTVWQDGQAGGAFVAPTDTTMGYGVRAISSMTYTYNGENALLLKKYQDEAVTANTNARTSHASITAKDGPYMDTIVKLMGDFMTWRMSADKFPNDEDKDCSNYVVPLVWLIRDMKAGLEQHGQALVKIVNAWQFNKSQTSMMTYEQMMQGKFPDGFNASGYSDYATFKKDYDLFKKTMNSLNSCLTTLTNTYGEIAERQDNMQPWKIEGAYWAQITGVVNQIVEIGTCTVRNKDGQTVSVNGLTVSDALNYTGSGNVAIINKGLLVDYEQLTGEEMRVKDVSVKVTVTKLGVSIPAEVKADVVTKWGDDQETIDLFTQNQNAMRNYLQDNMEVKDAVAGDTFGLVLDLWARTNAAGSILGLNGTIITRKETREVKEVIEGVTYQMYSLEQTVNGEKVTLILYQKGDTWYNFEDQKPVNVGTQQPMPMMETVDVVIEYTGDNRIWDENELLISEGATSTTQGNGSCYIYYADTPEAGMKSLELLKNLKIAFVSGDNQYLATASMDTEHVLQENGKYTVPLVITDSSCSYLDEEGNQVKGIMYMPQNQAVMISAIVYLDGEALKNEHVLAASDIQGSLNLQFKSSGLMEPISDLELMGQEITVSATLNNDQSELSFEYRYPFNQQVTVNLSVDGFEPATAEAFFQRQISESQGSRMASFPIDLNTGTGIATFTSPGTYILRYVRLDGVEYELEEPLTVTVSGFAVDSVQVGQSYFMTADQSVTTPVSVSFGALDADELPRTVQARFMTESGSAINVKLRPNANGIWVGDATFNSSGIYRLEYLVLDGQYSELVQEQVRVVEARLGMSTEVVIRRYLSGSSGATTTDLRFTYEGQKVNFKAYVKVKDDSGKYLTNLDTGVAGALKLYYKTTGSVGTVGADLKWDAEYGGYVTETEGFFIDAPGTYRFDQVLINGNSITNAYPSPIINAMYPDPPTWSAEQFYDSQEQDVFSPNSTATVTVYVTNAGTEKVWLVFADESGKLYEMQVTNPETDIDEVLDGDGNRIAHSYTTKLPVGADGTQEGKWTLVALKMADVNDGRGGVATIDKPYVLNLSEEEKIVFNVGANDFTLVFNDDAATDKIVVELAGENAGFMDPQKLSQLYAWLIQTGVDGGPHYAVSGSNLKLTFSYVRREGNTDYMYEWGGYTSVGDAIVEDVEVVLQMNDLTSYRVWESGAFTVAGKYVLSKAVLTIPSTTGGEDRVFTHVVGATEGNTLGIIADESRPQSVLPEVHVKTAKMPTVKVTGVSNYNEDITVVTIPDPMNLEDYSAGDVSNITGKFNSKTDYEATVYIRHTKDTTAYVFTYWNGHLPSVTLALSNVSNFTKATMIFPHSNRSYSSADATFEFTSSAMSSTKSVGYLESATGNDNFSPAGRVTVGQIQVTVANGTVYNVELSNYVTINQPQCPPAVGYQINDNTFSGIVPSTVYSETGSTITLTLPQVPEWAVMNAGGSITYGSTWTTESSSSEYIGYYRKSIGNYQKVTQTTTVALGTYTRTGTGTRYQVTGWKLGNTVYEPGATITIDIGSGATFEAVVSVQTGVALDSSGTVRRTTISYSEERAYLAPSDGDNIGSKPSTPNPIYEIIS